MNEKEYRQIIYTATRPERLAQMKRYYQANRERLIQYQRDYRERKKKQKLS